MDGILIGVIVGTLVALFSYWLNRNTAKKAVDLAFNKSIESLKSYEFIKAGNELKSAFSNTQELVANGWLLPKFIDDNLLPEIPKQKLAFIKFSAFLPDNQRDKFRKAWQKYKGKDEDYFFSEYILAEVGSDEDNKRNEQIRQLLLRRIGKVLAFTDA